MSEDPDKMRDTIIGKGCTCCDCNAELKPGDEIVWKQRIGNMYLYMRCLACFEKQK